MPDIHDMELDARITDSEIHNVCESCGGSKKIVDGVFTGFDCDGKPAYQTWQEDGLACG